MLVADEIAVVFGEKITQIILMKVIRIVSSMLIAAFRAAIIMGWA